MLLMNEEEVKLDEFQELTSIKKTGLHWLPANRLQPTSTTFIYQRTKAMKEGPQILEMFGMRDETKSFLELPSKLVKTESYQETNDTATVSHFTF